jgi:hypothetical protein
LTFVPISESTDVDCFLKYTGYDTFEELKESREQEAKEYAHSLHGDTPIEATTADILKAKEQSECCPNSKCNTIYKCRFSGYITQLLKVDRNSDGFPMPPVVVADTYRCPVWLSYRTRKNTPEPEKVTGFRSRKDTEG